MSMWCRVTSSRTAPATDRSAITVRAWTARRLVDDATGIATYPQRAHLGEPDSQVTEVPEGTLYYCSGAPGVDGRVDGIPSPFTRQGVAWPVIASRRRTDVIVA